MSGPTLSAEEQLQLDEALECASDAGEIETCKSASFAWYADAERDMHDYLARLQEEQEQQQATAEGATAEQPQGGGPSVPQDDDADDDFFPTDRSASYGGEWEDDTLADWQPDAVLDRRRRKGVTYYLVRWRGHSEDTWEAACDLEEEGHMPLVAAYLDKRRSVKPKPVVAGQNRAGRLLLPRGMLFNPVAYWPEFMDQIQQRFADRGMTAMQVYNVCRKDAAEAFTELWSERGVPTMLFHGTRAECVRSIALTGLRIPNTGHNPVSVANGSSYGVGVYTALEPGTSDYYTRGCGVMFVCAGLIQDEFSTATTQSGNICVFFDAAQVLPCFLVRYCRGYASGGALKCGYHPYMSNAELDEILRPSVQTGVAAAGYAAAGGMVSDPRTLRGGGSEPGAPYDNQHRTLTKRQLRAAPRAAKDAYKRGLLLAPSKH